MEWAVSSEQAGELMEHAQDVAYTEALIIENGLYVGDDLGTRNRMFFYVYDNRGELQNFSRAPSDVEQELLAIIESGNVPKGEVAVYEKKDKKGRDVVVLITCNNIVVNHQIVGHVCVGKDVTALYRGIGKSTYFLAGISLIALIIAAIIGHMISGKLLQPMHEAYERQRQFAADASHELRTPLSVVMASADLLESDPSISSPMLKQVVADLKDEVKKMSKLVGDLLQVSRGDANVEKLNVTSFFMGEVMEQVRRNMAPMAEKKGITLIGDLPDDIRYTGDEQKISQLVLILVDNAIKYTPEGGTVTIRLTGAKSGPLDKGGNVKFFVSDTGVGIAEEDQKKIFDRFYRVDKARSRAMGGNGLGLAIATSIVRQHQGKIDVESKLGEGTTFIVELKSQ